MASIALVWIVVFGGERIRLGPKHALVHITTIAALVVITCFTVDELLLRKGDKLFASSAMGTFH